MYPIKIELRQILKSPWLVASSSSHHLSSDDDDPPSSAATASHASPLARPWLQRPLHAEDDTAAAAAASHAHRSDQPEVAVAGTAGIQSPPLDPIHSPPPVAGSAAGMACSLLLTILPEELVVEILIRLTDLADLARAASACKPLRRLITSRAFLARLHALHAKPLLGLLLLERDRCGFLPAATAVAAAVARASDFAFSFLPDHAAGWRLRDVRHGLALLSSSSSSSYLSPLGDRGFFPDVVVCDPMRRRHVRVPPIPDDLTAGVRRIAVEHFDYLLAPAGRDGSSFRVVCRPKLPKQCDVTVFVFSSGAAFWRAAVLDACAATEKLFLPQSVHGYVYWRTHSSGTLLMLDTRDMDFFFVNIQTNKCVIGEAEEVGRLAVFNTIVDVGVHKVEILSKAIRGGADEPWRHDRTIPLLPGYKWRTARMAEGYLLLHGIVGNNSWSTPGIQLQHFTLDLKTLKLESLCDSISRGRHHHPQFDLYRSFPPPLSLSSI
uniref:F-box domain-containing protein n=1 Tax=Oryza nivara TaxID=4536 RepID=A0A0E0HC77_ORYNI